MRKLTFLLACLFFVGIGFVQAQTVSVSGNVISSEDNIGIPGATVRVKGANLATMTDANGHFSLKAPSAKDVLVVSFVGMLAKEVTVAPVVSIVLNPDTRALEEIVVTGYGVTTKKAFTGAASTLKEDVLAARIDANPINALQGNVAGLQMNLGSGQPGAPSTVFIRGRNSINSGTQPLYIIDGVPIETENVGIRSDEGQTLTPLSTLNAEDIETITVLKDATSTSIYGARAANGVIVITTKRGKAGFSVNFSAKVGQEAMSNIPDSYKMVDKAKYYELSVESLLNAQQYASGLGQTSYFEYYNEGYGLGFTYDAAGAKDFLGWYTGTDVSDSNKADVNWLDEVTRTGLIQNYSLDIRGGGELATSPKYFFSLDYLDNKAMVIGKDLSRYSMRYNFDHSPSNTFKFGFSTNLSYTLINMGAGGGYYSDPITQAYMLTPNTPVKNTDGSWNFATVNGYNPVAQRSELGDKSTAKQYRALLSPYFQLNFNKNFFFLSREGLDAYILDEFGYWSFLSPQGKDMKGMGENSYSASMLLTTTNTFNYINKFGKSDINLLVGQEGQITHVKETYLDGTNYPVDYLNEVSLASVPGEASTTQRELKLSSFFSRAEYSYDNKYYLSGSFRYDASSRFGANHRWAPFSSIGLKYRLSSEDFMASTSDWLNDFTIRTSYGTSGNQQVGTGYYASRDLCEFGYNYNSLPGSARSQFGNENLKWEQTAKFNLGIDFEIFDRISFTADIYDHQTKDMVFGVPVSRTTGLSEIYTNIGQLSNKGIELALNINLIKTKNIDWAVSLNGSKNVNKIIKLSTDDPIEGTYTIIEKGYDIYTFKMKEWAGVDPQTGLGLWYKNATGNETTSEYSKATKRYMGKASPDFQGGFSSNLRFRNFDMSMQWNYSIGGQIYGSNLRYDEQNGNSFGNNYTNYVYDHRWKNPGDIAEVPMLIFATGNSASSHSSRFLMDADYLKLRSLSLGYTIPKNVLSRLAMKSARIFVNAENLYTFSAKNYRGFDPASVDASGIQWWNYATPRTVMFGINVGF